MNAITDMQSSHDLHDLPINQVGIRDLCSPITSNTTEGSQFIVTHLTMTVFLPADQEGTYMSHFAVLIEQQTEALGFNRLHKLTAEMVVLLGSHSSEISVSFPFFCKKPAPVSGIQSLLDYDVTLTGEIKNGVYSHSLKVMIPVTSLCSCSKETSQYGAHNQRSRVTVSPAANAKVGIGEIIDYVGAQVSCQLYGLLERPDEKYVIEKTYENPKFIEDMMRDVATALIADGHTESFVVEGENFESIHNRSAYAYIAYP